MYTHIFINVYIFLYLWPGQQTNQNVYNDPTHKKIGATNQRKVTPTLLCLFIIFKRPSRPSEDDLDVFEMLKYINKCISYVQICNKPRIVFKRQAGGPNTVQGIRICYQIIDVDYWSQLIHDTVKCRCIAIDDLEQGQGKT